MQRQRAHITRVIAAGTAMLALLALFALAACGCSIPDDSSTPSSSKSEGASSASPTGRLEQRRDRLGRRLQSASLGAERLLQ